MSKIIREVDDCKDIKITIHSTLNDFINEYDLAGWIRKTPENDTVQLIKDNNTLMKENLTLSKQVYKLKEQLESKNKEQFGDFSFNELVKLLKGKTFVVPSQVTQQNDVTTDCLRLFIISYNKFCTGISNKSGMSAVDKYLFFNICPYYISFNLLEKVKLAGTQVQRIQTSKIGSSFYAMLEAKNLISKKMPLDAL